MRLLDHPTRRRASLFFLEDILSRTRKRLSSTRFQPVRTSIPANPTGFSRPSSAHRRRSAFDRPKSVSRLEDVIECHKGVQFFLHIPFLRFAFRGRWRGKIRRRCKWRRWTNFGAHQGGGRGKILSGWRCRKRGSVDPAGHGRRGHWERECRAGFCPVYATWGVGCDWLKRTLFQHVASEWWRVAVERCDEFIGEGWSPVFAHRRCCGWS